MNFVENIMIILCLIGTSCFFSMSEIALAASRKIKLRQQADDGDHRALKVLQLQESPGNFFTIVQIGLNGVASWVVLWVNLHLHHSLDQY